MKVIFKHKNGREQEMQERFAKTLQSLGRGTYMTRDMRASAISQADAAVEVEEEVTPEPEDVPVNAQPEAQRRGRKPKNKPE